MSNIIKHNLVCTDTDKANHDMALLYANEKLKQRLSNKSHPTGNNSEIYDIARDFYGALGVLACLTEDEIKRLIEKG